MVRYIMSGRCGAGKKTHTVREWLESFGIPANDEFFQLWTETIIELGTLIRNLEEMGVTERILQPLWNAMFFKIYINYDMEQEFFPQFRQNSDKLRKDMAQIAEMLESDTENGSKKGGMSMNKKQIAVLQRIIRRETAVWNLRPDRPHPGLHPSKEKFVVTDGEICVLLSSPVDGLPEGDRVDSLSDIIERDMHLGTHLRLPDKAIAPQFWRSLKHIQRPTKEPHLELSVSDEAGQKAAAHFKIQLLLDAVGAAGTNPRMYLGYGRFTNYPTLLVRQEGWVSKGGTGPVVLVLLMKKDSIQKGELLIGTDD